MRDFHQNGRSPVYAANGMAATSMPIASLTAIEVLRAGGNAVDAAVAACAMLAVVEPQSTGLGGDCFCLYAPRRRQGRRGQRLRPFGRGRLDRRDRGAGPAAREHHLAPRRHHSGRRFRLAIAAGRPWDQGLRRIAAARDPLRRRGLSGSPARRLGLVAAGREARPRRKQALPPRRPSAARRRSFRPEGARRHAARDRRARRGRLLFRAGRGRHGGDAQARGGVQTEEDFANGRNGRRVRRADPLQLARPRRLAVPAQRPGHRRADDFWASSKRWVAAPDGPDGATRHHRHIEAARLAYRDRDAFLADPRRRETPVSRLIAPDYLAALPASSMTSAPFPPCLPRARARLQPNGDTVTLSVVDRDGNACSLINSIYQTMGSGILAERSGVLMQNRGLCFSFERGHPNSLAPNTRPAHTIMPGMATRDGRPAMCFGVMGEHYQPMGQTWLLTNALEYGMDIQEALEFPRVCPYMGEVEVERRVSPAMRERLVRARPQADGSGAAARRRPGDRHRPGARRPRRRLGSAQGRRGARVLRQALSDRVFPDRPLASRHVDAAGDVDALPGHEPRLVRAQEDNDVGDVLGQFEPSERRLGDILVDDALRRNLAQARPPTRSRAPACRS